MDRVKYCGGKIEAICPRKITKNNKKNCFLPIHTVSEAWSYLEKNKYSRYFTELVIIMQIIEPQACVEHFRVFKLL